MIGVGCVVASSGTARPRPFHYSTSIRRGNLVYAALLGRALLIPTLAGLRVLRAIRRRHRAGIVGARLRGAPRKIAMA